MTPPARFAPPGFAVTLRIDRVADFVRTTALIGRLTNRADRARTVVDTVTATLNRVRAATRDAPRLTVFMLAWENPLLTIGGGSFLTELVEIAGAHNVFADLPAPSPQVSFEEVVRRNPDAILVGRRCSRARTNVRWQSLPAVKAGKLLAMDTVIVAKPAVRLGEASGKPLARLFHPGASVSRRSLGLGCRPSWPPCCSCSGRTRSRCGHGPPQRHRGGGCRAAGRRRPSPSSATCACHECS
ncbi:MAG: ABC transporter substrate-binding protein [Gemmatimonadaceae bacterium]